MARRPAVIRAHIVKNRYLMMVKNDTAGALLRDLPFVLGWEIAQWTWLAIFSPATLPHLWRLSGALPGAWRRRRDPRRREAPAP
jgi:hypothetical protein